ncbi:MAG: type II toxin-antitoxin system YoeB family toxin [Cyanobacteria bacterium J06581_3]
MIGNLQGYYSRRINIKHRLVYSVNSKEKIVKIVSVWSHYE